MDFSQSSKVDENIFSARCNHGRCVVLTIKAEQNHLWLSRALLRIPWINITQIGGLLIQNTHQNQITEFLHLHASLEGQLKFATLDDNVREIE